MKQFSKSRHVLLLVILWKQLLFSLASIKGEDNETWQTQVRPTQVGDKYPIIVSPGAVSDIQPVKSESGDTDTYTITHPDASYMSVHFNSFDLPDKCSMDVTNGDGTQSSTLTGKGRSQQGTFWAQHVTGDVIKLILKCNGKTPVFDVDTYAAGYPGQSNNVSEPGVRNVRRTSFLEAMGDRRELSICGADDKRNAICYQTSHPDFYQKARAVARLLMNGSTACTGWLVSNTDLLFTNEHCISSQNTVLNTDFEFMGEEPDCTNVPGDGSWMSNRGDIHDGTDLITYNAAWDYALIQLDRSRNPSADYGFLELDNRLPPVDELLFIPQHPGGRPKELGIIDTNENDEQCKVMGYRSGCAPNDMKYSCDTEGGSSGSPVLSRTNNKVVALHHCGGGCSGNLGAPITEFYDDIIDFIDIAPTVSPRPTASPTGAPSSFPTVSPRPSARPTGAPSLFPTVSPRPSASPTGAPTCGGGSLFELRLLTDRYGSETTWTLINLGTDSMVSSGGPYGNEQLYEVDECINSGCYKFTMIDSYGDGLCCGYGRGGYSVTVDGEIVVNSDGTFSDEEVTEFCTSDETCTDSASFISGNGNTFSCAQVLSSGEACLNDVPASHCPDSCNRCNDFACVDSNAPFHVFGSTIDCDLIAGLGSTEQETACDQSIIATTCRGTCNFC